MIELSGSLEAGAILLGVGVLLGGVGVFLAGLSRLIIAGDSVAERPKK